MTIKNPFRKAMITIMINRWFDRFVLLFILANCVFLAIDDPNEENLPYQVIADSIFQIVFTLEMIIKIVAMGYVLEPNTYLRNGWNVMDFVVVVMGWVSKIVQSSNVSALRVIRILRPLRTITSIPSMRRLVNSLLKSLPTMLDFFILFLFFLIIFGTVATQLFGGLLGFRCVDQENIVATDVYGNELYCNEQVICPAGNTCVPWDNPDFGVTSFDNILVSDLNIFIIITLEGWTDIMYKMRRATGSLWNDIFFHLVVIIGSFFIINLMIAVQFSYLSVAFSQEPNDKPKEVSQIEKEIDFFSSVTQYNNTEEEEQATGIKKKKCCCQCYISFSKKLKALVDSRTFNIITMAMILLNTLLMALQYYEMPVTLSNICDIGNSILTSLFAIEMVLKMFGLGPKQYLLDSFNVFDATIVIIGLLEYANVGSKAITVLRTFRLLRIFKLVRSWDNLRKLLQTVIKSMKSMTNLAILMLILMFIYSLMGMQLLSGAAASSQNSIFRINFNSFADSVIAVFVLLTAENWNSVLQAYIFKDGWGATMFFVTLIIFGNIMLLNLFLAILLNFIAENLDNNEKEEEVSLKKNQLENSQAQSINDNDKINEINSFKDRTAKLVSPTFKNWQQNKLKNKRYERYRFDENAMIFDEISIIEKQEKHMFQIQEEGESQILESPQLGKNRSVLTPRDINKDEIDFGFQNKLSIIIPEVENQNSIEVQKEILKEKKISDPLYSQASQSLRKARTNSIKNRTIYTVQGQSLNCFKADSKLRLQIKQYLEHPYFEFQVQNLIALNSFLLALDQPVVTDQYWLKTQKLFTDIISTFYVLEAILKIIMLGFVFGKGTYLRDKWNILDFLIVVISVLNWILDNFTDVDIGFIRVLRAFRALRPLKMVSKNEGLKTVVNSLLKSIPSLINVVMITLLFLLVFSILGVQVFAGALSYCNDSSIMYKDLCFGYFFQIDGTMLLRKWITPFNNYDNVLNSMVTFFEVATLEGWPDILFAAIDSQGENLGPIVDNRKYMALIFIVFIFITTFFIMNLFISVVVDKFNDEIKKNDLTQGFTNEEKDWLRVQKLMLHKKLKILPMAPRENKCRRFFYKISQSTAMEIFITVIIVLNTIVICLDYVNKPKVLGDVLDNFNIAFVLIFSLEAIIKLIGLGFSQYFREKWNLFDLIIVILSILTSTETLFPFKINSIRIIRIARLLRMVKASKGLRNLLKALFLSVLSIVNVVEILSLVLFTFSVAGMDLFGEIVLPDANLRQLNADANFTTFYLSFTTLFRAATGESWNAIMHDCYYQRGIIAVFYWLLFQIVSKYMFFNIFVAVIFEKFAEVDASEKNDFNLPVKKLDIKNFIDTWVQFCPDGNKYLKTSYFISFLQSLPAPLGLKDRYLTKKELYQLLNDLSIKSHLIDGVGYVYFPEVLWNLFHQAVGPQRSQIIHCEATLNIIRQLRNKYKNLAKNSNYYNMTNVNLDKKDFTVMHFIVAIKIYRRIKFFQSLKKIRRISESRKLQQEKAQKRKQKSQIKKLEKGKGINEGPIQEEHNVQTQFQNNRFLRLSTIRQKKHLSLDIAFKNSDKIIEQNQKELKVQDSQNSAHLNPLIDGQNFAAKNQVLDFPQEVEQVHEELKILDSERLRTNQNLDQGEKAETSHSHESFDEDQQEKHQEVHQIRLSYHNREQMITQTQKQRDSFNNQMILKKRTASTLPLIQ